jgi:tetratricopeptide (TPR) repeat protein
MSLSTTVTINGEMYHVNNSEFPRIEHHMYTNLCIRPDVGLLERIISLLQECATLGLNTLVVYKTDCGGFVPIHCAAHFVTTLLVETAPPDKANILLNLKHRFESEMRIQFAPYLDNIHESIGRDSLLFSKDSSLLDLDFIVEHKPFLVTTWNDYLLRHYALVTQLTGTSYYVYVPLEFLERFQSRFACFLKTRKKEGEGGDRGYDEYVLDYDNLNHLCIMVKNAGPQFEQMLTDNLPFFDRWTILDTGSTDETLDIIQRILVGKKKGNLYQEPFINFRDSRNRCLELAGTSCKFITMLDDTYVLQGDLRAFLNETRGDQYSSSFTLYISSDDTMYGSNRIIKSDSGLRYKHKIHEVMDDRNNINIVVPKEAAFILDRRFDYMETRTMERKQLDLKLLYEEVDENPSDPRAYYYLGQTYNQLKDYDKAFHYFMKRADIINAGFLQERVDALFEAARIANFHLNRPWEECEELYNRCYKVDESRPEAPYFIGAHYFLENQHSKAFPFFKKAFDIGFPVHCQYSLKPTLSYHFLPKLLTQICYGLKEYQVGFQASQLFLQHNGPDADCYVEMLSWYKIFEKLVILRRFEALKPRVPTKPILCFHADGGFGHWSGSSIVTTGVGGSETYIIEHARHIQRSGAFDVFVFCNCREQETFEGVTYKPLEEYVAFIKQNYIHTCIVSRFSEYLPVTFKGWTENVYLVLHDLTPSGVIIPLDKKLKRVFCLTEWHVEYFTQVFPALKGLTVPFYYGIDMDKFQHKTKQPFKFIYSSFPNRGLLQLLQMWPRIHEMQSLASLHLFCDVHGKWVNDVEGGMMQQVRELLAQYEQCPELNVFYHGWVDKQTLADAWATADIWFYPCTFQETFCLTALEAAMTKTLVITNHLAALQNTVGQRGAIIKGDAADPEWQERALAKIKKCITDTSYKNELIEINYAWASQLSWANQSRKLLQEFLLQETLEYKGMFNWTNDVPIGHRQYFLEVIEHFNKTNSKVQRGEKITILEIGTYTGTSLLQLVQRIPNSIGYGLDRWSSYAENELLQSMDDLHIESSFYKNIATLGMEERVFGIKGDSERILMDMVVRQERFDFIYVDGSHLMLDCYTDLVLSWNLLRPSGILAIDDYCYNLDDNKPITSSPFEAVNHFLAKYGYELSLLHKGYRVFVQKK